MLTFIIRLVSSDRKFIQTTAKCPYCGCNIPFYYYAPEYCTSCDRSLPDFGSVLNNTEERLEYHRYGTAMRKSSAFGDFASEVENELFANRRSWGHRGYGR